MEIRGVEVAVGLVSSGQEAAAIERLFPGIERVSPSEAGERDWDVLWVHFWGLPSLELVSPLARVVKRHLARGGGVLLSLGGLALLSELGLEKGPIRIEASSWRRREDFGWKWDFLSKKGFQGFLEHPVFQGLGSSAVTWASVQGKPYFRAWFKGEVSARKVLAKRKKFIFLEAGTDEISEYKLGQGRLVAVSSLFYFADEGNPHATELKFFTENLLLYLSGHLGGKASYWPQRLEMGFQPANSEPGRLEGSSPRDGLGIYLPESLPRIETAAAGEWFDVAGRQVFAVGRRGEGIKEIWTSPVRIAKDLKISFLAGGKKLKGFERSFTITPLGLISRFSHPRLLGKEFLFCSQDKPGGIIYLEVTPTQPLELELRFRTDFRLMWPYPVGALGKIFYRWLPQIGAFLLTSQEGGFSATLGGGSSVQGGFDPRRGEFRLSAFLEPGERRIQFVFSGGRLLPQKALEIYQHLLVHAREELDNSLYHYLGLAAQSQLKSPDPEVDAGYLWAKVGLDKLHTQVRGVGAGYFAGYGPSRPTEFSDGRPGYAWYFGRDSEWMSLGALGYGDFEGVRDGLETLLRYQNPEGKILHEITTSGVANFDAADSTPLLIIVFDEYVKWSGDLKFLRSAWPQLKRALDYLYSTDSDGDGFIENSGVGHGWTEGGKLTPFHVSFYLASVWVKTLHSAARLARLVGEGELARRYQDDHRRLRKKLVEEFWDEQTGFFRFAKRRDGSYIGERTVTAAVALDFHLVSEELALKVLQELASSEFTSDWGVRFIGRSSPLYQPDGYQQGSVWPLFTGWVAQAEYNYHQPVQGFAHLMANLAGYRGWNEGFLEEVLHGETYKPNGVCSHQGWSEGMALYPLFYGLVGFYPNAPARTLALYPHLPPHWEGLTLRKLPFGREELSIAFSSEPGRLRATLESSTDQPISVMFSPGIPIGSQVTKVRLDGKEIPYKAIQTRGDVHVIAEFPLLGEARLTVDYRPGIAVVPPVVKLVPGQKSRGIRIVEIKWVGEGVVLELEAPKGEDAVLEVISPRLSRVQGAEIVEAKDGHVVLVMSEAKGSAQDYERYRALLTL